MFAMAAVLSTYAWLETPHAPYFGGTQSDVVPAIDGRRSFQFGARRNGIDNRIFPIRNPLGL